MSKIVAIHSFQGGTGKSNIIANVAAQLALRGRRVGIVDTDLLTPGLHFHLRMTGPLARTIHDYLLGQCAIEETVYDMGFRLSPALPAGGALYLVPGGTHTTEITRGIRGRYNVARLHEGFQALEAGLKLDYLLADAHAGLCEETLVTLAAADAMLVTLRPDHQDFQGTAVVVEVGRRLEVTQILLVVNMVLPIHDAARLRQQVAATYDCPVAAVLPLCEGVMRMGSGGLFSLRAPEDPFSRGIVEIADRLGRP